MTSHTGNFREKCDNCPPGPASIFSKNALYYVMSAALASLFPIFSLTRWRRFPLESLISQVSAHFRESVKCRHEYFSVHFLFPATPHLGTFRERRDVSSFSLGSRLPRVVVVARHYLMATRLDWSASVLLESNKVFGSLSVPSFTNMDSQLSLALTLLLSSERWAPDGILRIRICTSRSSSHQIHVVARALSRSPRLCHQ